MEERKDLRLDTKYLKSTVSPGDDFDEFVNGSWRKMNPIPATESSWGSFTILNKENEEIRIRGLIERLLKKQGRWKKGSDEQKVVDMYLSYMDTDTIEKLGLSPLENLLSKLRGLQTKQEWLEFHAEAMREGIRSPFRGYVHIDEKDSAHNAVYWTQGGLSLGERSFYLDKGKRMEDIRKEFVKHVNKIFALAKLDLDNPGKSILELETAIAELHKSKVAMRDPVSIYNPTSLDGIAQRAPKMDWIKFAEISGLRDKKIVVHDLNYLSKMESLVERSTLESLKLYSEWQVITRWASLLPEAFRVEHFRFFSGVINGKKQEDPRDVLALRKAEELGGSGDTNILGRIYAKEFFTEDDKKKVAEMIENIRSVYKERIQALDWMSPDTKRKALVKLKEFKYKIAYPDKWRALPGLDINPATLLQNDRNMSVSLWNLSLEDIGKQSDKSRWEMSPQTVNAYFLPPSNEIVFPAAILQPPFFDPGADDALNYGGIMAVIGHEFTHGFDDEGSKYDEKGNLHEWWSKADRASFDKITKAYSKYFSQFEPLKGTPINGDLTLGENIADLGGITLAYYALERSIRLKGDPGLIDGFTWQQRFFLSWAHIWKNNTTDEALMQRIKADPHSPARFRVNGPLPHFAPFYEAFGITKENLMYIEPKSRIAVW